VGRDPWVRNLADRQKGPKKPLMKRIDTSSLPVLVNERRRKGIHELTMAGDGRSKQKKEFRNDQGEIEYAARRHVIIEGKGHVHAQRDHDESIYPPGKKQKPMKREKRKKSVREDPKSSDLEKGHYDWKGEHQKKK